MVARKDTPSPPGAENVATYTHSPDAELWLLAGHANGPQAKALSDFLRYRKRRRDLGLAPLPGDTYGEDFVGAAAAWWGWSRDWVAYLLGVLEERGVGARVPGPKCFGTRFELARTVDLNQPTAGVVFREAYRALRPGTSDLFAAPGHSDSTRNDSDSSRRDSDPTRNDSLFVRTPESLPERQTPLPPRNPEPEAPLRGACGATAASAEAAGGGSRPDPRPAVLPPAPPATPTAERRVPDGGADPLTSPYPVDPTTPIGAMLLEHRKRSRRGRTPAKATGGA